MAKELKAGVSISDNVIQVVVLEFHSDGITVRHLNEFQNNGRENSWFINAVLRAREEISAKITNVSVVLDYNNVFLLSFPLDTSLTQPEQNEQVQWELSNYIEDYKPREYISDIHILRTRARDQVSEVLAVNVKRDLLFTIQHKLADEHIDLHLADIHHFGAQHVLLTSYPELRAKTVVLAGISKNRIDAGILTDGRLKTYRYGFVSSAEECTIFLQDLTKDISFSEMFVYGTGTPGETVKSLQERFSVNVSLLNPFRKLMISPSFRDFGNFAGQEHHFASCVGCALRTN